MTRSWETFSEKGNSDIEARKLEYEEKIKNVKGNETLGKEYDELKLKFSDSQKKEATYDKLIEGNYEEKYNNLLGETNSLKIGNAFNSVKPSFPTTVNNYEVSAKWDSFKTSVLNSNTLELVDNEWMAVDKENKHKVTKLTDLVGKDADLTKLLEGRQQQGLGGKEKNLQEIEGVPFQVPENSTAPERSKLIRDHLASKGINPMSKDYSKMFTELNTKIRAVTV